jgi:predicted RNA polymerase sigma factor
VRAKRTLSKSGLAYETPHGAALSERLASVLEVVYLIFNEGYTAARGDEWLRPQLCHDALRMGRVLTAIAPLEAEAHGLLALARAHQLGGGQGFYALQAAIVACHARAATLQETDWPRIAGLYAELAALVGSPIIELNRAVAIGMAQGPSAALAIVDGLAHEPALKNYHLLQSVRGDLLSRLGRFAEARAAFEIASTLAANKRERELLRRRAAEAAIAGPASA